MTSARRISPRRLKLALLAACALVLALPGVARALDYIALGDSVASGYGLHPARAPCYRTSGAYPRIVLGRLRESTTVGRFSFLACSGASATGETGSQSLRWQVTSALARMRGRPTLVSITIGINDLEWWNVSRTSELLDGDRETFDAWLRGTVADVRSAVRRELDRLLARRPVSIVLTEYYDPFNQGSPIFLLCADPGQCRARTEEVVTTLNRGLRALAGPRVRVASVQTRFEGHEAARPRCGVLAPGPSRTWIQPDCLHPNRRGAKAIAAAVNRAAKLLAVDRRMSINGKELKPARRTADLGSASNETHDLDPWCGRGSARPRRGRCGHRFRRRDHLARHGACVDRYDVAEHAAGDRSGGHVDCALAVVHERRLG